ncbi:MAG: hybrid sensor histidine kinase/response regulator, partial [Phototrophicales bacterium]
LNILESLVEMLGYEGFEAYGVLNGEIALREVYRFAPDLIISDVTMPEVDGFTLLQELRSNAKTAAIPLIFLTARTEREDFRQGMALGADDYITKPFKRDEVLDAIRSCLNRRAALVASYEERIGELQQVMSHTLPHELRTPLTSIIGYAEYLGHQPDQVSPDEIAMCANAIYRAGQRLYRLIENYLLYMRLSFAKHEHPTMYKLREHYIANPSYPAERLIREVTEIAEKYKRASDLHYDIDAD